MMPDRIEIYHDGELFTAMEIDSDDQDWGSKLSTFIHQTLRNLKKQDM